VQRLRSFIDHRRSARIINTCSFFKTGHFETLFEDWHFFTAAVPAYARGFTFGWASDNPELRQQDVKTMKRRSSKSGLATCYYTPDIHRSAFVLPHYILDAIGKTPP